MQATTLEAIGRSDCALAIWRRNAVDAVSADLAALDHDAIDDIDTVVQSSGLTGAIAARLAAAGYPARLAARLTEDIAGLGATFAGLCGQAALKLRLEWIETDACRRFHADQVTVRLLCTYLGQGTQWKRAGEPDEVRRQLAAGDVAIFKGRLLAPDAPILHRSPPIGSSGERRLLLVLDAHDPAADDRATRA